MNIRLMLPVLLLALLPAASVHADDASAAGRADAPPAAARADAPPATGHADDPAFTIREIGDRPVEGAAVIQLGNIVRLDLPGLKAAQCNAPQQFALILNGLDLNLRAAGCDGERLTFDFSPAHALTQALPQTVEPTEHAWRLFLGNFWQFHGFVKPVSLSLRETTDAGPRYYRPATTAGEPPAVYVKLIDPGMFGMILAVLVLAMVLMMWLSIGHKATLLRDSGTPAPGALRPYSLSRCQMGWWFMIVLATYGLVTALSGHLAAMPASTLALIGMSGATGLAAKAIDTSKGQVLQPSRGYFWDVLSDGDGVTLARFQLMVWNLLLGVVFVVATVRDLVMPEFDATILGLLGISSGVYTGFKIPENHTPSDGALPAATPAPVHPPATAPVPVHPPSAP